MASSSVQPLAGMSDIFAPEVWLWQDLEARARRVFALYGLREVRTPLLERAEVFHRAIGEGTDVVQKEMYAFEDRGGRRIALRPEGTAGVMRHLAGLPDRGAEAGLYYMGPMFRAERPQAGRRRQFHQIGVEKIGPPGPAADAECIAMQVRLLREWGLDGFAVRVNSRGSREDHVAITEGVRTALLPHREALCEDCRRRIESNPLRILDCKQPACGAIAAALPPVTAWMAPASVEYLGEVLRLLTVLDIPAEPSPRLIRGLDYYRQTIWEITHGALGAQDALAGGGRYEIEVGGQTLEGVGFAIGMERVVMALTALGVRPESFAPALEFWVVAAGAEAVPFALRLLEALRQSGHSCGADLTGRSVKAQMRTANRAGAPRVLILGPDEIARGTVLLKNMADGVQSEIPLADVADTLKS